MMKERVFPDTTKHPIPDESCSRLEPLVQEELEFSWVSLEDPEFPDDPELPEEPPQQPTSRKLRKMKTVYDEIAEIAFNSKKDFIYRKFYLLQSKEQVRMYFLMLNSKSVVLIKAEIFGTCL